MPDILPGGIYVLFQLKGGGGVGFGSRRKTHPPTPTPVLWQAARTPPPPHPSYRPLNIAPS